MPSVIERALVAVGVKAGMEEDEIEAMLAEEQSPEIDFNEPLPGEASDMLEVFLSEVGAGEMLEDTDGILWAPMIRAGQMAMRPGPRGQKVRRPLRIVAGHSEDPIKQIGLADLKDAFDEGAVEYVTVPLSHENKTIENTGFIRGMKIMDAPITSGPNKGKKAPHLFGGYEFTEPDIKGKVKRSTIPSRSCGILYNYINTETGKSFKSVIEHVALTAKPWIRGMMPFGRKVALSENLEPEALVLSDELPEGVSEREPDVTVELADEDLATTEATVTWTHEDSPNWLREQVNELLRQARAEKHKERRNNGTSSVIDEVIPYYRCIEAKSTGEGGGKALVSDGYGEGANFWVANVTIDDGQVEVDEFSKWQAVKSVYVADDRDPPEKKNEPLSEQESERDTSPRALLLDAHNRRRSKLSHEHQNGNGPTPGSQSPTPPRGGEVVATAGASTQHELSEEAAQRIQRAEEEARQNKERADRLAEQVEQMRVRNQKAETKSFVDWLKGIGFSEERGFSGMLVELSNVLEADDGDVAVVGECFSDDGKTEVSLSLTEAFTRVFKAIELSDEGKAKLGEQLAEPSTGTEAGKEGEGKPSGETDTKAGEAGDDGKPPAGGESGDDLSVEKAGERARQTVADNPHLAAVTGIKPEGESKDTPEGGEPK